METCGFAEQSAIVLVYGDSGTGKELVAECIHKLTRENGNFHPVNVPSLSKDLVESEMFGHKKGAFTGAHNDRVGKFEEANDGTVFLDEVAKLELATQSKMMRVLDDGRSFSRVGENEVRTTNATIVLATNKDLPGLVADDKFHDDLFHRINARTIRIPDWDARTAAHRQCAIHSLLQRLDPDIKLDPGAMEVLLRTRFPGNVRQVKNLLDIACTAARRFYKQDTITPSMLNEAIAAVLVKGPSTAKTPLLERWTPGFFDHMNENGDDSGLMERVENAMLNEALRRTAGNITEAADLIGISETTLHSWVRDRDALSQWRKAEPNASVD